MEYGDDTNIPGASSGLSDGAKLGILGGVLGLTALTAWAYSDNGPLGSKKKASGPGYGPTMPIGSEAWAEYQANQNPSSYAPHAYGAPGFHQDHRAQGGGPGYGPTMPIGSEAWAEYQMNQTPSSYAPHHHGAPGGGVRPAGHGALEADHRAQGGSRSYICGGGETAAFIAAKYGRAGAVNDLIAANPGINFSAPCAQNTQIVIPDAWPLMGGGTPTGT